LLLSFFAEAKLLFSAHEGTALKAILEENESKTGCKTAGRNDARVLKVNESTLG